MMVTWTGVEASEVVTNNWHLQVFWKHGRWRGFVARLNVGHAGDVTENSKMFDRSSWDDGDTNYWLRDQLEGGGRIWLDKSKVCYGLKFKIPGRCSVAVAARQQDLEFRGKIGAEDVFLESSGHRWHLRPWSGMRSPGEVQHKFIWLKCIFLLSLPISGLVYGFLKNSSLSCSFEWSKK